MEKIALVLWSIWFARNQKIWEEKVITPAVTLEICRRHVAEWQEAMKREVEIGKVMVRTLDQTPLTWQPPHENCLKLNVNASVFTDENSFSLGMVIRDDKGKYVSGRNMRIAGKVVVVEAEARGVEEAISWIEEMGLHDVTIECDSEIVVLAIHNSEEYYLEAGHSIEYCKLKLAQRPDLCFLHIKKQANQVAHRLARAPCLVDCFNVFESPPVMLLETLSSEYSY